MLKLPSSNPSSSSWDFLVIDKWLKITHMLPRVILNLDFNNFERRGAEEKSRRS